MNITNYRFLIGLFISIMCVVFTANAQLYINEWMPKNGNTLSDEEGDFDDWIEIYNAGTEAVDLAGYYMSDELEELTLWQIPNTNNLLTTVPANGYLLLWADKDLENGAHHLDFKLSSDGETIVLLAPDATTIIDQVSYDAVGEDISYGRSTDGGNDFQLFLNPTPNLSNNMSSSLVSFKTKVVVAIESGMDDVEEQLNGSMIMDGYDLELGEDWSEQKIGLRFNNLPIAQNATIIEAYLQFSVDEITVDPCSLIVKAEAIDNAPEFEDNSFNVSNRTTTDASVEWNAAPWSVFNQKDAAQRSTNLNAVIQEVIDRPGWDSGNAIALIISGSGKRTAFGYEGAAIPDLPRLERIPQLELIVEYPGETEAINDLYINEISANATNFPDEYDDYSDWIELYNGASTPVEIGGLYLTDDFDNLTKWQISAPKTLASGEFAIIYADEEVEKGGFHANFNLKASGEQLALVQLVNGNVNILDSISYSAIPIKASFARTTDGGNDWDIVGEVTPNASNDFAGKWLAKPTFSLESGAYTGPQTISISHEDASVSIYYTTDGSIPDESSNLYTEAINISNSTAINAIAVKDGHHKSLPEIQSFLLDLTTSLPVMNLTIDPTDLYDDENGIYVDGTNGLIGKCQAEPRNYYQDWERPVKINFIEEDKSSAFNVSGGIKIAGGCSRRRPLKSFNLYMRKNRYGDDKIEYPIFPWREQDDYTRLKLRNSGQDYGQTYYRDGIIQSMLHDKVDIDLQAYRPAVVYINGEYWGMLNLREHMSTDYLERNHDADENKVDLLKYPGVEWQETKAGSDSDYQALLNYAATNDLSDSTHYSYMEEHMDINEFLNYYIAEIFIANQDWPGNNSLVWKAQNNSGKWRWMMFDLDISSNNTFWYFEEVAPEYNSIEYITDPNGNDVSSHFNSTMIFRKLLENEQFKAEYIQRSRSFMELIFSEERANHFIDSIMLKLNDEVQPHIDRWMTEDLAFADRPLEGKYIYWLDNSDSLRNFFERRELNLNQHIKDHFNLNNTFALTINYDQDTKGDVFVNWNKMDIPYNYIGHYFKNVPLEVTAVAKPGYSFSHWLETGDTTAVIQFSSFVNAELTPIFEQQVLIVDLGDDIEICLGEAVEISAEIPNCPDCTYQWDDAFDSPFRALSPTVDTRYIVTVTNALGTTGADTLNIIVNPLPDISIEKTDISCYGLSDGQIDLTVNNGLGTYQYLWNTEEETADLDNLNVGNYSVVVTDEKECQSTEEIEIVEPDSLSLAIVVNDVSCFGFNDGSIQLSVSGGVSDYVFEWNNEETDQNITALSADTYMVNVSDGNNCMQSIIGAVNEPAQLGATSTITEPSNGMNNDGQIEIMPSGGVSPYTANWDNGAEGLILTDLTNGTYILTLTDANDCTFEESYLLNTTAVAFPEGVLELTIAPNPTNGIINVEIALASSQNIQISLFDALGKELNSMSKQDQLLQETIDLSSFADGIYFVKIQTENGSVSKKILLLK